jgi:hypothetical protein
VDPIHHHPIVCYAGARPARSLQPDAVNSVRAVLDENPSWVDVALDAKNAFNSIHRRTFLKVIAERFPSLWSWVWSNYGEPTELYVRRDNLNPEIILSRSGTRQGCPLGAQLFGASFASSHDGGARARTPAPPP